MTLAELHAELRTILTMEQTDPIDWPAVEAHCLAVIRRLATEPKPGYPHGIVYHFLDDPDIRAKDARYAWTQRDRLAAYLEAQ
jgi:hypothetical protein